MKLQLTLVTALLLGLSVLNLPVQANTPITRPLQLAQDYGRRPQTTYMTPQNATAIAVDIRDGSFYFATILRRTNGSIYSAIQNGYRVIYDRSNRQVTVIDNRNGEELYNYFFTEASSPPSNRPNPPASARGVSTLRASNPNTRINVRSQPTVSSSSPHYGLPGDRVRVMQCVQDQDNPGSGLNWCRVQFVQSGATGWIRSDFIIFADGGE
ncbi:SH3 domain-containing protein [Pantanalinema rosaneae CENA516]|uniref:SH3 domain-containing protein n=1 Tax=Pantanalinema rosaneae TaxID=1620701 RepID=UPI003D6FBC6C